MKIYLRRFVDMSVSRENMCHKEEEKAKQDLKTFC
jgi:hypothetical protein